MARASVSRALRVGRRTTDPVTGRSGKMADPFTSPAEGFVEVLDYTNSPVPVGVSVRPLPGYSYLGEAVDRAAARGASPPLWPAVVPAVPPAPTSPGGLFGTGIGLGDISDAIGVVGQARDAFGRGRGGRNRAPGAYPQRPAVVNPAAGAGLGTPSAPVPGEPTPGIGIGFGGAFMLAVKSPLTWGVALAAAVGVYFASKSVLLAVVALALALAVAAWFKWRKVGG